MRKLQVVEINMVSGSKLEGGITAAILDNTFISSIIFGGLVGACTTTMATIDAKASTGINALAGLVGFINGALTGAVSHDLGSLKSRNKTSVIIQS